MKPKAFVFFCIAISLQFGDIGCSIYGKYLGTTSSEPNNKAKPTPTLSNGYSQPSAYTSYPSSNPYDPYAQQKKYAASLSANQPKIGSTNAGASNQPTSASLGYTNPLLNGMYQRATQPQQAQTQNTNSLLNGMYQRTNQPQPQQAQTQNTNPLLNGMYQPTQPQQTLTVEPTLQVLMQNFIRNGLMEIIKILRTIISYLVSLVINFVSEKIAEFEIAEEEAEKLQSQLEEEKQSKNSKTEKEKTTNALNKLDALSKEPSSASGGQKKSKTDVANLKFLDKEESGDIQQRPIVNSDTIETKKNSFGKMIDDKTFVSFVLKDDDVYRKVTTFDNNHVTEEIFKNNMLIDRRVDSKPKPFEAPEKRIQAVVPCTSWSGDHQGDVNLKMKVHTIPAGYIVIMSKVTPDYIHYKIIDNDGYLYEEKYTTGSKGNLVLMKFNGQTECETPMGRT